MSVKSEIADAARHIRTYQKADATLLHAAAELLDQVASTTPASVIESQASPIVRKSLALARAYKLPRDPCICRRTRNLRCPLLSESEEDVSRANAAFIASARADVPELLAEIERLHSTLHAVLMGAAEDYRQCIVSARATFDGGHYEKCNGRAEAYRQAATRLAEKTGLPVPDWDRIRRDVPPDGVYRATPTAETPTTVQEGHA